MWVNDYHDEDWLHAEDAWYVESPELNSPMGWGVAAFRDEASAVAMREETGGELLTWEEIEGREWSAPPAPMAYDKATPSATPTNGHVPGTPVASPMPMATPDHSGH